MKAFLRLFLIGAFCAIVSLPLLAGGGEQSVYDADEESSETVSEETQNESLSSGQGTTQPSASTEQQAWAGAELSNVDGAGEQSSAQTQGQGGSTQGGGDKPSNGQNSNSQNTGGANKEAKERETSLENRALSGATMAVTGLGAMQLAQGLAEQSADRDADAAMTAYLEHLKCKIGDIGREYSLSNETEVATPGDELSSQRSAYAELAYSIKTRKEQLGLRPGIESEIEIKLNDVGTPYIERTDGLYNDVGSGAGGTYASLYRAKMGNEADQAKIDADKGTSKARVVGGGVAAGVGAVGGVVGNIKINGDAVGGDASVIDKAAGLFLGK